MADKNICFTFKRKSQYYHENKKDHQNGTSNYRQNKVRTKAAVRRLDDFRVVVREKKSRIYPFKIKPTLTERKSVKIKKNGELIKRINVRIKSHYFSGNSARVF